MFSSAKNMRRIVLYWIPAIAWMGVIFLLSQSSSSTIEKTREGPLAMLPPAVSSAATSPNLVHPVEFGILAVLIYRLLASYEAIAHRYALIGGFLLAVGYGVLDEIHQSFVPGRYSTLGDVGLDALGALIGLMIVEAGVRLYRLLRL